MGRWDDEKEKKHQEYACTSHTMNEENADKIIYTIFIYLFNVCLMVLMNGPVYCLVAVGQYYGIQAPTTATKNTDKKKAKKT